MPCHHRNPTTVSFPGDWASADWHPPVLSLLQIPLKESDEANMAAYYVFRTLAASSSLGLFSNHGRNRPRLPEQRAVFVFLWAFYFRRVPPCACAGLWCVTHQRLPPPPRLLIYLGLRRKACWEEGRREEYKREEKCFLSFSISSLQLIVFSP